MKIKSHYEKYWSQKHKKEEFYNYERNWVLPSLFDKKEKVLDLGCGDGAVAEFLDKKLGMDVVGFDISPKAVKEAKKRGVKAVLGDIEKSFPFPEDSFDSVFWGDNIEHLFSPEETLKEIREILKKNGRLILSCPNMGYWRYRIHYLFKGQLPDTEWSGNPPWGWSHIRFFNVKILKDLLNQEGFRIVKVAGVNRRFPDKFLAKLMASTFGMILVIEAHKNG